MARPWSAGPTRLMIRVITIPATCFTIKARGVTETMWRMTRSLSRLIGGGEDGGEIETQARQNLRLVAFVLLDGLRSPAPSGAAQNEHLAFFVIDDPVFADPKT